MTGFGGIQPGYNHAPTLEAGQLALPVDEVALWCGTCGAALWYEDARDVWVHHPIDLDPWDHSGDRHAVALVISNTYRARHGMEPLNKHASVDEDIAEAILASGWLREHDAERWEEGVRALDNSSSVFTRDTLAKNPYREAK